ncbi:MAG: class I SAM-dependent methyltransferase [Dehalococcoidia bacterium]|nr:class I SAM-dependent methyltransferase [Dehalococcoidia bacterium]
MTDLYAADATFYDAIHAGLRDDIGLWLSFAGRTDRPVLEVGCGTGRIAIELAKAGHTVVGIDASPAMLGQARRKAEDDAIDVEWVEGSLTSLALEPGRYGFVLIPQDVFLYCEHGEEQIAWLQAIAAALQFNGTLAIDLPGPALGLDPASNGQQVLVFAGETSDGTRFDAWQVHEDDLAAQTRWLRVIYEQVDDDGLVRRRSSEHQLRYVYRFEIEYLLAMSGLVLADIYGDYDLGPLTNDSERMIVIARRVQG